MTIAPIALRENYWENFEFQESDLEFLYNYLLEVETPQTSQELVHALVAERIRQEKQALQKQQKENGAPYLPKEHYPVGQYSCSRSAMERGKLSRCARHNPEIADFEVFEVAFATGSKRDSRPA